MKDKTNVSDVINILRKFRPEDVSSVDSVLEVIKSKICN